MHGYGRVRGASPALGEGDRLVAVALYCPLIGIDMHALRRLARHAVRERVPVLRLRRPLQL
jgi:hypothetical protein